LTDKEYAMSVILGMPPLNAFKQPFLTNLIIFVHNVMTFVDVLNNKYKNFLYYWKTRVYKKNLLYADKKIETMPKKSKLLLVVISLLFGLSSIAQKPKIEMSTFSHDFGEYIPTYFPPAAFEFTNTGSAPLAILTAKSKYEVKVMYERKYIFPGETGVIYIHYQSQKLGPFNENIEVYTNASLEPFSLNIKGNNISVNECYPNKDNREIRKVIAVDAVTKKHIPNTEVKFYYQQEHKIEDKTDKDGKAIMSLPIGIYDIEARHPKYYPLNKNLFITKSMPIILLELQPKDEIEELLANVEIEEPKMPVPKPKPIEPRPQPSRPMPMEPEPMVNTAKPGELSTIEYKPNNVVFLVDISLSMRRDKRLQKLKKSMDKVIRVLRDVDNISLITYNQDAYVLIKQTTGAHKDEIKTAIDSLTPRGLTNGVRGLETAYDLAWNGFVPDGNNQIILATDGEFSGSHQSEPQIMKQVKVNAERGVLISIISFGEDREALVRLRKIARIGKGSYIHIKGAEESPDILIEEIKARSKRRM